jgi:O-antigen ligase
LDFQPPYFSTFVLFSIYILAAKNKLAGEKLKLVTRLILIVFLVVILILLSSRMTLFFGFISAVVYSIIWIHRRKLYWRGLVAGIFMLGISLWLLTNIPLVKERFKEPFRTDFSVIDGGGETTLSIRWIKWKCSIKGILDSPFFGTGTGDSIDYLVSCYEKEKFWGMYPQYRFNSHNQYLELTLTLGLGALFILFYIFYRAFKTAIIRKNNLYFIFLLLVSFVCLTESFLERQWGLVFFVLFISLFSKSSKIDSAYV